METRMDDANTASTVREVHPARDEVKLEALRKNLIRFFDRRNRDSVNDDVRTLRAIADCFSPETKEHLTSDGKIEQSLVARLRDGDEHLLSAFADFALQFSYLVGETKY